MTISSKRSFKNVYHYEWIFEIKLYVEITFMILISDTKANKDGKSYTHIQHIYTNTDFHIFPV